MKKEYDIFISYRREGGKEYARNLTSELVSRGYHPFLDFDELKDGKFDKRITDAIESAPVFLFILSPGSLERCVNEDDWVRKEILHAVEHKRHIVPVDIDKQFKAFPSAANFPQKIKDALGQHQFSQIQTEKLYKVSIDEMVKNRIQPVIDEYMREKQKAAGMTGAEIHIETDMNCHVQRFHRDMIIAKVDEENVIHLPKGKHKLQFISVKMIHVEGGTFMMGEGSNAHQVTLSSYFIGETTVTQLLWKTVMNNNPSRFIGDNNPVENVSWHDCQKFIKKLNQQTKKHFRLLTEAEWEFAARGGNKTKGYTYSGSNNIVKVAWYNGVNSHPVKMLKSNELGIYDMSGNVWEWCQDWYDNKEEVNTNSTGPTHGSCRVGRGGSWYNNAKCCETTYRFNSVPESRFNYLGFRLALSEFRTPE